MTSKEPAKSELDKDSRNTWLTSKEAKKALKVSDCSLAHLRMKGKLEFTKKGNSFFYSKNGIQSFKAEKK